MHKINIPGMGVALYPGTKEQADRYQSNVDSRHKFCIEYCKKKGWPTELTKLSVKQIMEIRECDEWKNAR